MKSTVPAGTGAAIRRDLAGLAYVSCPEFLKEGSALDDFLHPDRVVIGADPGDEWAADEVAELYRAGRRRAGPHRRRLGRDDQARLECLPRDQDLVHQRDRQRLRGGRRGRHRGRPRDGARPADRLQLPAGRDRLRGVVLPQGHRGAEAARRQHRLPLPAADRGDRGQRAAEAAGDRRSSTSTSARSPGSGSPCSASRSSPTPTTCARPRAWCSPRASQGEGAEVRAFDPVAEERARGLLPERRVQRLGRRGARRMPTQPCSSPSGPSSPSSTGPTLAARMATPLLIDGRNFLDPAALRAAGFTYEGIGRGGDRRVGRGRRTDWTRPSSMQALILVGGEGTRLRPLTLTRPKPALPLVDRPVHPLHGRLARPPRRRPRS